MQRWPAREDVAWIAVVVLWRAGKQAELIVFLDRLPVLTDRATATPELHRMNNALGNIDLREMRELVRCFAGDKGAEARKALEGRLALTLDPLVRPVYLAALAQNVLWGEADEDLTTEACARAREAASLTPWSAISQLALALCHLRERADIGAARDALGAMRRREFDLREPEDGLLDAMILAVEGKLDAARAARRDAERGGAMPNLVRRVDAEIERRAAAG